MRLSEQHQRNRISKSLRNCNIEQNHLVTPVLTINTLTILDFSSSRSLCSSDSSILATLSRDLGWKIVLWKEQVLIWSFLGDVIYLESLLLVTFLFLTIFFLVLSFVDKATYSGLSLKIQTHFLFNFNYIVAISRYV